MIEVLVMNEGMLVSGIVLAFTFLGIFTEHVHGFHRAKFAMLGAILMIIVGQYYGFYNSMQAVEAVDWNVVFHDATGAARAGTLNLREMTFADKTRDILFHSSMFPRDGDARWISGAAVFFGWVKDPEPRVRIDDARIQAQDYTLFRAIFPLPGEEEE